MPDGKALQSCTSHFFGDNFARAFGITFPGPGRRAQAASTRPAGASPDKAIGALIMVHGDDSG